MSKAKYHLRQAVGRDPAQLAPSDRDHRDIAKERGATLSESPTLSIAARLLLLFCRKPGTSDYPMSGVHYESGKELDQLEDVFPDVRSELAGKVVIDFGCGNGHQSIAFALAGAQHVVGIEIDESLLESAKQRASAQSLADKITFAREIPNGLRSELIITQNSFEHLLDAGNILAKMRAALSPKGKIFLTFAPPWYAPWGAHMGFFCNLPWVQIFFREQTVMEVRSLFRSDAAYTYREAGLAEMSIRKFEDTIRASGLRCTFSRYDCVYGMAWLRRTPLRELFVNRISCVLTEPG